MPKLSVKLDHIATLREAKKVRDPDPISAAVIAELAGANGISVNLREDRKHIQERDVKLLRQTLSTKLTLEMTPSDAMVQFAIDVLPDMVILVPETGEGMSSSSGLNLDGNLDSLGKVVTSLRMHEIYVCILIEPDIAHVKTAKKLGVQCVEIHCGSYTNAYDYGEDQHSWENELDRIDKLAQICRKSELDVIAGQGINFNNVEPLASIKEIEELIIGHSLVARGTLVGLDRAVRDMLTLLNRESL